MMKKILIIDDDLHIGNMLEEALTNRINASILMQSTKKPDMNSFLAVSVSGFRFIFYKNAFQKAGGLKYPLLSGRDCRF